MAMSSNVSQGCGAWLLAFVVLSLIGWAFNAWMGVDPYVYWGRVFLTLFVVAIVSGVVRWLAELRNPK